MRPYRLQARKTLRALAVAGIAASAAGSPAAYCQDQGAAQGKIIEEIVITGTRIRQTDQGALPVQTITQQQIEQSGAVNPEQFLQSVSIAVQGNTNSVAATGSGATSGGVSSVSLRGLGSQRTLVLINGRRVAGGGTITDSTTVDVNNIPLAAIDRVDVLKDSASAVYGSDALAGVINFIIRDNYEGYQFTGYGGGTSDGGGDIKRVSATAGFGNLSADRYNILFAGSFEKDNSLFGAQRGFASSGINVAAGNDATSGNTFPANVRGLGGTKNPFAGNCTPSVSDPLIDPTGRCRFDPSPFVSLLPGAQRYNLYSAAHFALTQDLQLYAEASYSQSRQRFVIQPVPLSEQFAIPTNNPLANQAPYNAGSCGPVCATLVLQPGTPYYPTAWVQSKTGGATPALHVFYRDFISGNRDLTDSSGQPRAVFGMKGSLAGWDFDTDLLYSQTQLTEYDNGGYPAYSRLLPLLNSGVINFFGATGDPNAVAQAQGANYVGPAYKTKTTLAEWEGSATREVVKLPAGSLAMAVDLAFRKEKFETDPSAAIQSGDIAGYGGNFLPQAVQRNVLGATLEFQVPILKGFSASPALRYDHYQGTGSKTTPKISLRWKPLDQLLLRGSYSRGFRAPSLTELFQPQTLGASAPGLSDPLRCPTTNSSTDCNTQFNIMLGGNTRLAPETTDTFTLGFIVEPLQSLSLGVDAFSIKLKNTIIFGIDQQTILNNQSVYGYLITRGAPQGALPGPITSINQLNANFGETDVKGFDADFRYRTAATAAGTFTFSLVGSYFATYRAEQPDGSFLNEAGRVSLITNGNGGTIPRWHHFATLTWGMGPWQVAASHNYQSAYQDLAGSISGVDREVSSYSTLDLQAAYSGIEHVRIALGARNALNKDPPYSNVGGQNYFQAGYDPGYSDPRGRFLYGTVSYSFGGR